jgi:predicted nuclease of predicted toxin-antitoxin system
MKLLIDMNLSPRWVKTLAEAEIEASHWSSLGPVNASDAEIMSFARTHGYVVLTHDLDFSAILAATQDAKPSVVQIRAADVRPETAGPVLIEALRQMAAQLEEGALLTVDPARARMRVLPLGSK